jgi:histidine phosphotransferase ChpT
MEDIRFASILCSRLCHDLVSPVGAFANGMEILNEEKDPEMRRQVMELLEQSARQTSNRLQFFRIAFGAAGGLGEMLDLREAHKALSSLFASSNIELDWQPAAEAHAKDSIKLLLNLGLIAGEGLIRGGRLSVDFSCGENSTSISVIAEGERFILQDKARAVLSGELDEADMDPRTAPAFLAVQLARQLGGAVEIVASGDTGITLKATLGTN